ncbi:MAG: family 43 glycosylhydrolase [Candidatus Gallimonas sp.]
MYQKIRPGKNWYDTSGKRIQAHGGSVLFAEGKFWWYGENKEGITGKATGSPCPFWHHGVKLYSSDDLMNWTDEGFAVKESADENNPFHPAHIMDRPHILFNPATENYVLWAKTSHGGFGECSFSVCAGKDLHDLRFVHEVRDAKFHAGDFDLFLSDGNAYVVYENPHTETVLQKLTDDFLSLTPESSSHLFAECPPFVREAPAFFERRGKKFLLTSGTTGYYPNRTKVHEITAMHGEWKELGYPCRRDGNKNSFHAQFSSVFRHPFIDDLYVAIGDRWLRDLPPDLPDMDEAFYQMFANKKTYDLSPYTDSDTSEANYVWLPVRFRKNGTPYLEWADEWTPEDFRRP